MGYMATTNKKLWWKVNPHVKLNHRRQVFEIIAHTSVIVAVRNFSYAVPEKAELFLIKTTTTIDAYWPLFQSQAENVSNRYDCILAEAFRCVWPYDYIYLMRCELKLRRPPFLSQKRTTFSVEIVVVHLKSEFFLCLAVMLACENLTFAAQCYRCNITFSTLWQLSRILIASSSERRMDNTYSPNLYIQNSSAENPLETLAKRASSWSLLQRTRM